MRRHTPLNLARRQQRRLPPLLLILLTLVLWATDARAQDNLHTQANDTILREFYEPGVIDIKFADGTPMRIRDGAPRSVGTEAEATALEDLYRLAAGGRWQPIHDVGEAALDELRRQGQAATGQELPDLNNYMRLILPPSMDEREALKKFGALPMVEWVGLAPRPAATPDVPDFTQAGAITGNIAADRYQRYLDPAPEGIDARWAWLGADASGAGVRICDLEKNVNPNHADLTTIKMLSPAPDPANDDNHGTAVMGILGGADNGFGVRGIAYQADLYFAATTTVNGFSIAAAVTRCANALRAGDIIVIEAQTQGPNTKPLKDRAWSSEGLVPVEWDKPTYDAIKTAVAAGRIVFEAGSNGAEDLDAPEYRTGNGGHHPFKPENDSGAILVGAGNSPYVDGEDPRAPSWFTNFGATMDVQGWGDGIVTTGYGDLHPGEADENERNLWFKRSFGGTSGATPIVAGAAAVLQDTFKAVNGRVATPTEIKALLRASGTPQNGPDNIGPLPNLREAIIKIYTDAGVMPTLAPPTITPAGGTYAMPLQVTIGYGPGQNQNNTQIRYTLDGSEPGEDSFIFIPSQGDTLYLNYGATVRARAFFRDNNLNRTFESPVATAAYASSTPKVATPTITPSGGTYSQGQQFTLSTTTPGATIRYRTDGRAPSFFYPGAEYTGPITLAPGVHEIVARGYKDGYYKSDAAQSGEIVVNEIQLPAPTLYPDSGEFTGELTVYMGSTVLGAELRYTLDGSEPTPTSPRFEEPLTFLPVGGSETYSVKTRVFLPPYTPSNTVEATYVVIRRLEAPVIDAEQLPNSSEATVTITADDADAVLRYTTNGAEPTSYSTQYAGPFTLGPGLYMVKARAFLNNAQPSNTTTLEVAVADSSEAITDPVIAPFSTQTHVAPFSVTMRTDTPDAVIRYTVTADGSLAPDPTPPGQGGASTYDGPLLIDENGQYRIKAQAFKSNGIGGFNSSNVIGTGTLTLTDPLGAATVPAIDPPGGIFTDTVEVRLSSAPNEVFFYTLDGSEPVLVPPITAPSQQANAASIIDIEAPATLTARAYRVFFSSSDTAQAEFYFICATPTATSGGTYTEAVELSLETTTSGAQIRYTLDGSEPTPASALYTGPFTIGQTTTLKAKCFRSDFTPSETATELYVIGPPAETPAVTGQPEDQSADAGEDVTLKVVATGIMTETAVFQWQFNGRDIAGETEPSLELPNAQAENAGAYRVIIRDEGGETTSQSATVTINEAAITGLTIDQDGPTVLGEATNFAAGVTAGGGIRYSWDFGDGNTGAGPNPSHVYGAAGSFTVTVTAENSVNSLAAQTTVQIVAEAQAIAGLDAGYDGPTPVGATTTFFATVNEGTNVTYGWDFGDGGKGSGPRVEHTYAAPGVYPVTITASNPLGSASITLQAQVLPITGEVEPRIFLPTIRK